jgi:hypothetical protein
MEMMRASQRTERHLNVALFTAGALALWLGLVFVLGAHGSLARTPGALPLPILIGVAGPVLVFLAAFFASRVFRQRRVNTAMPAAAW